MAEVVDQEKQASKPEEALKPAETSKPAGAFSEAAPAPKKKKKNRKKTIRRIITLVLVAALVAGGVFVWKKLNPPDDGMGEVLTDVVYRGSITSKVEGSGATVAKNSASVTVRVSGTVRDVYVSEGDMVTEGTQLYVIDSPETQEHVTQARQSLENAIKLRDQQKRDAQKQLTKAEKDLEKLEKELRELEEKPVETDVPAPFNGILVDVEPLTEGKEVTEKVTKLATLADNTRMLLSLYFSYAYEGDIYVGQDATVSIPVTMAQLSGRVHELHKIERISPEGSRLFEVVVAVDNPGTLTADMAASATLRAGGETIYPYDSGKLRYFDTKDVVANLTGELTDDLPYAYTKVRTGDSIAHIRVDLEEHDKELENMRETVQDKRELIQELREDLADAASGTSSYDKAVEDAQKTLDEALEDLEDLNAVAPIDGTVVSIGIDVGDEVKAGTVTVSIADTSLLRINAMVDEMYIKALKTDMLVDINVWGEQTSGTIEKVSLTPTSENGISRFPVEIAVDNSEGKFTAGTYMDYSFAASQSDDCLIVPIQSVKSAQTADGENCKVLFVQSDVPPENVAELAAEMTEIPEGFYPVIVEIGISDNYNVEILSGVEEGTTVYSGVMQNNNGGMGMFF